MSEYTLRLSEDERARYLRMARMAAAEEADLWELGGIVPGARIADIGCGPGAMLATMARIVGEGGAVVGVDGDPAAVAAAADLIAADGLANASVRVGDAAASGLEPGSFDVVVLRHVLAHNGAAEQALVDHAASLARPGGCLYLADIDSTLHRQWPPHPLITEMWDTYNRFQSMRGNDLKPGLRLAALLEAAGLDLVRYTVRANIFEPPPGLRGPPWAARREMVAAGLLDEATYARWEQGAEEFDRLPRRPMFFFPLLIAVGRRPE